MTKTSPTDFAGLLQRFFAERLIQQRGMSPRTVESYRDSFRLLLNFAQQTLRKQPTTLTLQDVAPIGCHPRLLPLCQSAVSAGIETRPATPRDSPEAL